MENPKYLFGSWGKFVTWLCFAHTNDIIELSRTEHETLARIASEGRYFDERGDTVWLNECVKLYKQIGKQKVNI